MKKKYVRLVTVAGSDSGGGAGIQADLKTFSALGCYGMSVITAVTAQNTRGVSGIHAVPVDLVAAQMDAVFSDIGADAVKIGMLFSPELIRTVAERLRAHGITRIVLDPVMVAQSGDRLLQQEAIDALKTELLSMAAVVTPNLPEAEVLLGYDIGDSQKMETAARELSEICGDAVLIKGGHLSGGDAVDVLYLKKTGRFVRMTGERIATTNNHGTGCTLSSAVAAYLARGRGIEEACRAAKGYLQTAIRAGADYTLGEGHGPVHHFHPFWE